MQVSEVIAGAGTILTCSRCRARVGTLRKPLYQGWNFGLDIVQFVVGQQPDPHNPTAQCRRCGGDYSQQSSSLCDGLQTWIHTDFGWLPPSKPNVSGAVAEAIQRVS